MCGRDAQRCRFFLVVCSDFSLPWNETNRVSCSPPFNPPFLFFNFFLTMLHSYHSRYNDGNWTLILAYFCPRQVGRACGNRYILIFEQPIRARVSGYILDIQITH